MPKQRMENTLDPLPSKGKTVLHVWRVGERALLYRGLKRRVLLRKEKTYICGAAEINCFTAGLWAICVKIYGFKQKTSLDNTRGKVVTVLTRTKALAKRGDVKDCILGNFTLNQYQS